MVKNKFAALMCTALAAVMVAACGGAGSQTASTAQKQQVNIETSSQAVVIGDVASVSLTGTGPSGAVGPFAMTYSATTGKITGSVFLAPGTYSLTLTAFNAASVAIGTATANNVVVSGTAVTNVSFTVGSILEPLPVDGFVVTGFTATGYADVGTAAAFSITTAQAGTAPTFAWKAVVQGSGTPGTPCAGTFAPSATAASVTYTDATAQICVVSVTATAAGNTKFTATRSATLGVGVDVSVSSIFVPSPTVTAVGVVTNGGYTGAWKELIDSHGVSLGFQPERNVEASCSLIRSGTNIANAATTCGTAYKINSAIPEPFVTLYPAAIPLVATEMTIGVTYDLGGVYDATKPPKLSLAASCPGSASNGVSEYDGVTHFMIGSGPGTATCPAAPAVCTGSAFLFWTEPVTIAGAGSSDMCTLTITVDNQGATDSFPLHVLITQ